MLDVSPVAMLRDVVEYANEFSDDPRTKNAAVLVSRKWERVFAANTLPSGVARSTERFTPPTKYRFMEHAERAAIYKAAAGGVSTTGSTVYCPWFACTDCARGIISAGVREVVGLALLRTLTPHRWEQETSLAEQMLREAGVSMLWITETVGAVLRFDDRNIQV